MIITRSPFRITLGGGGTDLPSYYHSFGGFLISAAIDKYVYITLHTSEMQLNELVLKYSKLERVKLIEEIEHPIIRECLKLTQTHLSFLEIASMADIPAGTGLGSSGSFTTALLKALYTLNKDIVTPEKLAEAACHIEIDLLKEPVGKQDQYIASYGGITCLEFAPDGAVNVTPLKISEQVIYDLEDHLLLFFTGYSRSSSYILKEQDQRSKEMDQLMLDNLHFIKELGKKSQQALLANDLITFAELMNVHWEYKKKRSNNMSNSDVDRWYQAGLNHGAIGGKMIGAGGGGFLMFYAKDKVRLREEMKQQGLREVRFKFDFQGTQVVAQ